MQATNGVVYHGTATFTGVDTLTVTTNLGFGGDDWKTLFFTRRVHLGSVNLKIAGIPVPVAKKA